MAPSLLEVLETKTPTAAEMNLAQDSLARLSKIAQQPPEQVDIEIAEDRTPIRIPGAAIRFLYHILTQMARGNAVTIIPVHAELTTQEAADLLGVSRPFLIKLLKEGKLPFHKVGSHRRIRYSELQKYQKQMRGETRKALDELVSEAQELNMGY
jgi:excisionase family DNA binding protein